MVKDSPVTASQVATHLAPQTKRGWLTVFAAAVAVFMSMVDMTIVTAALPDLESEFGVHPAQVQWALIAYSGAVVAFLLPSGRWLDHANPRAALAFAVSGFTLVSVLITTSPSFAVLVSLRAAQGAFCALLLAQVPGLVVRSVPAAQVGRAIAVVGTVGPLGAVSGPPLGTAVTSLADWEGIFLVNVPVGLVVLVLGLASVPGGGGLERPSAPMLVEAFIVAGAATALFAGLTLAAEPDPTYLGIAGLLLTAGFLAMGWARLAAGRFTLKLLRPTPMRRVIAVQFLLSVVGGALLLLAPYSLDRALQASPLETGLVLMGAPLGMCLAGPVGGVVADRWGAGVAAAVGAGISALAAVVLVVAPHEGGSTSLATRLACVGIGLGLAAGPVQTLAIRLAPVEGRGSAGALSATARQFGFAAAPPICMLVWVDLNGSTEALGRTYLVPLAAAAAAVALAVPLFRVGGGQVQTSLHHG
jgi:MFS family permease